MYLKELTIHGFKSFATKTTLSFLAPKNKKKSVTAIVGPNGSGKSNVSDAIRWVLGEQRMKQLRGKKSEDIIFSGSDAKGKMGMASVSMTLDNSDGRVDIDYDEVIITRKLYRSGESEYLINGSTVRLLDLQLLLAKAQFGHGSYAVVGQGMIDKMILQSPQERKAFFDEASGIKELQIKRHQSGLKLRRTKEHIEQAELLLHEISPRLKTLSRQVKKLEERQELEIELREKQESYYVTMWQHNQNNIDILQEGLKALNEEAKDKENKLKTIQSELAELARAESRQDVFDTLQREHQAIVREKNDLERQRAVIQGKLQTEYQKVGKQNVSWLEGKIQELQGEKEQVSDDLQTRELSFSNLEHEVLQKEKEVETVRFSKTEIKNKIAQLQQQILQAKTEQSVHQFTGLRAVQAILEERHRFGGVFGAVAQLGKVEKKYQLAMDVAAGGQIASVVVEDDMVAKECVEYLREYRLGYATFLPLNKIRSRNLSHQIDAVLGRMGVHGLAIDLVTFDSRYNNIFSYVFGSTIIVDNIDVAREVGIGSVRMVTLDGDVLETSGSIKGGYRKRKTQGLSFSGSMGPTHGQKAEELEISIDEKIKELQKLEIEHEVLQGELRDLQSQVDIAKHNVTTLQSNAARLEKEIASLEQELSYYSMSPEEFSQSMKDVSKEKEELDAAILVVDKKLKEAEDKITDFNAQEEEKKKRVFSLQDAMQGQQLELNTLIEQKNEKQVSLAKLETKQEDLITEMYQELHISVEAIIKKGIEELPIEELESIQANIQKIKYKLSLIGGIDESVINEYNETKERHEGLTDQMDDLKKAMLDLEKLIDELDSVMKKRRAKAFKEIKKEFKRYFSLLFEGGKADLVELYGEETSEAEEENEELEEVSQNKSKKKILAGIDISACPPGKKIKNLQSLSGGERTMTSIALICAILKTNPSPFVVLDEVEAALDEANSVRFTNILQELSKESQFILITHNRATMHAADVLYGVTMGYDGISHLLSVKLAEAQASVE